MIPKSIFVTCGATVPFPKLVESIISNEFVGYIVKDYKFNKLVIQYGLGYSEQFQRLISKLYGKDIICKRINHEYRQHKSHNNEDGNGNEVVNGGFYFEYKIMKWDFVIIGLEYSNNVQELISESRLVISHAGTGSILDTLRYKKKNNNNNNNNKNAGEEDNTRRVLIPLIVVINDQLMDNHQEQIANKFSERKYLIACHSDGMILEELMQGISDLETGKIKLEPFPQSYNEQFAEMLVAVSRH